MDLTPQDTIYNKVCSAETSVNTSKHPADKTYTNIGGTNTRLYNIGRIIFSLSLIIIFAAGLTPTKAAAQNLNPTVEVTNEYQAKTIEVNKPLLDMAVPDTVMRFQLDFDYSIAPNPYKGSYSFTPYVINVQPESYAEKARTLYLRVGAGYSLHPTVDIVFTPRFKTDKFSMSIYGTHRSYFGKYRSIGASFPAASSDNTSSSAAVTRAFGPHINYAQSNADIDQEVVSSTTEDNKGTLKWDRSRFSGYNSYTNAGIYGRADWNTGLFSFDVGYTGYARRDSSFKRSFDMLHAKLRVASRKQSQKYFFYDFSASYLYGTDVARTVGTICPIPCAESRTSLTEQDFCFNGILGPVFSANSRLLFDVRFDLSEYSRYFDSYSGRFSVTPKYILRRGRWLLNLGVKISALLGNDHTEWDPTLNPSLNGVLNTAGDIPYFIADMHNRRGQYIYPDVEIGFDAVRDHLNIYLKATGGDEINTYSSLVASNPFLSLNYAWNYGGYALMDNTVERINARFGLQGNIASKFSYNLYGGYASYEGLPLDLIVANADYTMLAPGISYADCHYAYANLDLGWHSADVTADAYLSYVYTDLSKRAYTGLAPAGFKGGFNVVYNWRKRIYVGLHGAGTSAREGDSVYMETYTASSDGTSEAALFGGRTVRLPGWFDLGLSAEYRFNSTIAVWAYASNLLNQTIQLSPLYCASGISLTAGITLTL